MTVSRPCAICGEPFDLHMFGISAPLGQPSMIDTMPTDAALERHVACFDWSDL